MSTNPRRVEDIQAILWGRNKIAKLAQADGEHIFAQQVLAGCWDHRNDVAKAIAEATSKTRVR